MLVLGLGMACSGSGTATSPTPTPTPPPVAVAPTLACPSPVSVGTTSAAGTAVTYAAPAAEGGQSPVIVTCAPASGTTFSVGQTSVECSAKDAMERTASCAFPVTVTRIPSLSKTRFLAFGDSITAGEVSVPVAASRGQGASVKLIVVPSAAYPTVLAIQLAGRYKAQEDAIAVANYGLSGEKAVNARDRFIAALGTVRPDVVLLMQGSNDIAKGEDGAASGAAREIGIMVGEARRRGMTVFLATVAPGRPGGSKTIPPALITDYNNRMRAVAAAEGASLIDINAALATDVNRYIGVDGLHPNEVGYAKIAETFFNAIRAAFEVP
jgi:lysophospholipase L1-like esterase